MHIHKFYSDFNKFPFLSYNETLIFWRSVCLEPSRAWHRWKLWHLYCVRGTSHINYHLKLALSQFPNFIFQFLKHVYVPSVLVHKDVLVFFVVNQTDSHQCIIPRYWDGVSSPVTDFWLTLGYVLVSGGATVIGPIDVSPVPAFG